MASRRAKGGPSEFQTFVTNSQEQTKREESHSHLQVAFRVAEIFRRGISLRAFMNYFPNMSVHAFVTCLLL